MSYSWTGRQDTPEDRIHRLNAMIDKEVNPIIREHYRNVIRQLQTHLEQL